MIGFSPDISAHDRVVETSTTPGTGPITLLGAMVGFLSFFAALGVGVFFEYAIIDQAGAWETGLGFLSNATTLVRMKVYTSSNSNALVTFSGGTLRVFNTLTAFRLAQFASVVPTKIDPSIYFYVPDNTQAVFALSIEVQAGAVIRIGANAALVQR